MANHNRTAYEDDSCRLPDFSHGDSPWIKPRNLPRLCGGTPPPAPLFRFRLVLARAAGIIGFATASGAAHVLTTDAHGRIHAVLAGETLAPIRSNLYLPSPGWKRLFSLNHARDRAFREAAQERIWTGRIELPSGRFCRYDQTIHEAGRQASLRVTVMAESDLDIEGVFFCLEIPVAALAAGKLELIPVQGPREIVVPPRQRAPVHPLASGTASEIVLADAGRRFYVGLQLDQGRWVQFQDNRFFNSQTYGLLIAVHRGKLSRGQRAILTLAFRLADRPPPGPAVLSVHPARRRYNFDGFGGNYCFGLDSAVTAYTLRTLPSVWARSEMLLREWEPENDNASPVQTHWDVFRTRDREGSPLRRRFLVDQQLAQKGSRLIISLWRLPDWMCAAGPVPEGQVQRLAPGHEAELMEAVGSYLLHQKQAYRVEPELFSFNEPDVGVFVRLSPDEYRDRVRQFDGLFRRLALKTRLLLGDTHSPRDTVSYAQPAAADPSTVRAFGAVGFHSWGGATRQQYEAWADLAARLRLPLLVTEVGVDPEAWKTRSFDTFPYGLSEARMIQELLLYARPQGLLYWEYTSDYALLREKPFPPLHGNVTPALMVTSRYGFLKQFADTVPPDAVVVLTGSSHPDVLVTALTTRATGPAPMWTVHVWNGGAGRLAILHGLPPGLGPLRAIRTSEEEYLCELSALTTGKGDLEITLAPRSLLTLTTLPQR